MVKNILILCIALFLSNSAQASGNLYLVSRPNNTPGNFITLAEETLELIGGPTTIGDAQYTIAFSPDGSYAYIPNEASSTITVLETEGNTIVTTIHGIPLPVGAAVTPDGSKLLVTGTISNDTDGVYIVDTENFTVENTVAIRPGTKTYPAKLAITPDGKTALIPLRTTAELAFFDIASETLTTFTPLERGPIAVVISSDGSAGYAATGAGFQKVDIANQIALPEVLVPGACFDLALSPDGHLLYAQNFGNFVHVFNASTLAPIADIAAPVTFLALSNDGARLFTPSSSASELLVIDAINFTVDTTVPLPQTYWIAGVCPIPNLETLTLQATIGKDKLLTQTDVFAQLSWTTPEKEPHSYLITRNGVQIATLPADATSFIDHNLEKSQTYLYEIFAHGEFAVIAEGVATAKTGT